LFGLAIEKCQILLFKLRCRISDQLPFSLDKVVYHFLTGTLGFI